MRKQLKQRVEDNYILLKYIKKNATAREAHNVVKLICKRYHFSRDLAIMKYHYLLRIGQFI